MKTSIRFACHALAGALSLALVACASHGGQVVPDARDADERLTPIARVADERTIPEIEEAFISALTPEHNIDSLAAWTAPDGSLWVIATAKATDVLVVYDGATGKTLRTVGKKGDALGQFDRPNGVAVIDNVLFVVERDNRRVQMFALPDFTPLAAFGAEQLKKPYGLWVQNVGDGAYGVYVSDAYMAGEDAEGEDILPPLSALDERIKRYVVKPASHGVDARYIGSFGDTSPKGALRVVESLWGDAENNRLLIAEEDETYANELKVYDLAGRWLGSTIGTDVFIAQSEGIMLRTCGDGRGWWITTEQGKGRTVFHLFDRHSFAHVGAVTGRAVANTDGIWLHQSGTARFPDGVLYAVHDDQGMVAFDWRDIAGALSLPACTR